MCNASAPKLLLHLPNDIRLEVMKCQLLLLCILPLAHKHYLHKWNDAMTFMFAFVHIKRKML